MLVTLSPAKRLDLSPVDVMPTHPRWPDEAARLARTMRGLTLTEWRGLMDLSQDLARLNRDRFRVWSDDPAPGAIKPAVLSFAGDTYQGLEAWTLSAGDLQWAQDHLRLLSGLYGLLRPLDGIQPYRLEMGTRLKTRRGASLYEFWGDRIAKALVADAEALGSDLLVNCASEEYFRAADRKALKLRVLTPVFLEVKGNRATTVSFFAKRARGAMARFIVENRLGGADDLRDFRAGGYAYDADASTAERPVFSRPAVTGASARVGQPEAVDI